MTSPNSNDAATIPSAQTGSGPLPDALYRALVEDVRDYAIFVLDLEGRIASANCGAELILGYKRDEIIGSHVSKFYPEESVKLGLPERELEVALRDGRYEDEGWRVRKDGERFWASVIVTSIRERSGTLLGFSKITRDLTERRRQEEELRHAEERFRMLIDGVIDYAIFMLDRSGHITSWNTGARRIKGYTPDEIVGRHFSIFYTPEAIERGWPQHELREAERVGHFEDEGWRVRKDGTRFWANVVITAMRNTDGTLRGFSKITRDLTERIHHEERLRRSEERFRLLVDGVQDYSICMLDNDGRVSSWNTGARRITGYRADEIIGHSFERFYPEDDVLSGRPALELRNALTYRRAEEHGWRVRKDGSRYWAHVVLTSLRDAEGKLLGYAHVSRDMSEQKRMEALEEQGRHVTEFLAMLAHELRNPLAPIRNAVGIMAVSKETSPQIAWCREVIEGQITHLSKLVDDLLDVSRVTRGKLQMNGVPMDLHAAVNRAVEAAKPLIDARGHQLEVRMSPESLPINGDMTRLTQVVLNLLTNAAKYTPEGGRIEVDVHTEGDECVLKVKDNGLGIPPELLERVFDLFAQGERTLDRSEGGLGIGLTLAKRIVILHGGTIKAKSDGVGHGSEFIVRLPRLNLAVNEELAQATTLELPRRTAKRSVLVVDDNADSAASIAMFLRMFGHQVEIKGDGVSALEHIMASPPEVVLLDIGLPGLDGYEVAKKVRERPEGQGIRLYAMTGYGQEEDRRRALAAGFDAHLVKPVPPNDLIKLIEAIPAASN